MASTSQVILCPPAQGGRGREGKIDWQPLIYSQDKQHSKSLCSQAASRAHCLPSRNNDWKNVSRGWSHERGHGRGSSATRSCGGRSRESLQGAERAGSGAGHAPAAAPGEAASGAGRAVARAGHGAAKPAGISFQTGKSCRGGGELCLSRAPARHGTAEAIFTSSLPQKCFPASQQQILGSSSSCPQPQVTVCQGHRAFTAHA